MVHMIGENFIEGTKKIEIAGSDQSKGFKQPPLQSPYPAQKDRIDLPKPQKNVFPVMDISEIISQRKSLRNYQEKNLDLNELSYLLWSTQGVRKIVNAKSIKRTVPSAGSRYPLETYLVIQQIKGLSPGLYRYLSIDHQLIQLKKDEKMMNQIVEICHQQKFIGKSALLFIWTANIYRMQWRHGARAYRYVFLEAGHAAQNLYLASRVVHCGTCAIGVFNDDQINQLVGVDGKNEFTIYMAAVGKDKE